MTRFARELSGELGAYWKASAEKEIAKMQERADNDEIRTNTEGGAFWNRSGNYLPADCAEILSHTGFPFSLEETNRARKAQNEAFLKNYRHETTAEERAEMRAAFGKGTTVVDVISGERISL